MSERRIHARLGAALGQLAEIARRRDALQRRLDTERHRPTRLRLLEELDAMDPLIDAVEELVARLAAEHAEALAELDAVGGQA